MSWKATSCLAQCHVFHGPLRVLLVTDLAEEVQQQLPQGSSSIGGGGREQVALGFVVRGGGGRRGGDLLGHRGGRHRGAE